MRYCRLVLTVLAPILLLAAQARPQGYAPDVAPARMAPADGLAVNLYAAEPDVRQPILVKFDDRGRLWTIQYLQYPNPAGLRRVKVDRFSRTVYDRVPEPPPKGPRGDDRITICEDTDGDGRADRFKDFVTGLNLCTGLAFGHGGVYVLQVPYLLFYPDRDRDDVPDGDPEVLLSGFGMEDAQSLANHLTWGPDGWLYGVTGSTSSNTIAGVEFQQAVWRFHPLSRRFELFCEGGGNLFGLTFDADGNLFFSSNGNDLAYHAVQGAYYRKNFGKHGPLHNPYAYGFFEHLPYDRAGGRAAAGRDDLPRRRLAGPLPRRVALLRLPAAFGVVVAARAARLDVRGGLRRPAARQPRHLVLRPDLCQGPDGAVYVCDFHDRAHRPPRPRRELGPEQRPDLPGRPAGHEAGPRPRPRPQERPRAGRAARATRTAGTPSRPASQLAARRDPGTWPALTALAGRRTTRASPCKGSGACTSAAASTTRWRPNCCGIPREYVRAWTVRLLGDDGKVSPASGAPPRGPGGDRPERGGPLPARRHGTSPARRRRPADRRATASPRPRPRRPVRPADALVGGRGQGADRRRPAGVVLRRPPGLGRPGTPRERPAARPAVRRGGDRVRGTTACERLLADRAGETPGRSPGRPRRWAWPSGSRRRAAWAWPGCSGRSRSPSGAGLRRLAPPFEPLTNGLARRRRGRLACRPGRPAAVAPGDARRAWPGRSSAVLAEAANPATAPARRASCSACSPSWATRGASRSPSALLEGRPPVRGPVRGARRAGPARRRPLGGRLLESYRRRRPALRGEARDVLLGPAGVRPRLPRAGGPQGDRRGGGAGRPAPARGAARRPGPRRPGPQALGQRSRPAPPRRSWPRCAASPTTSAPARATPHAGRRSSASTARPVTSCSARGARSART